MLYYLYMWEEAPVIKKSNKDTHYLLSWMESEILTEDRVRQAELSLKAAEKIAPSLKQYRTTPQSAPWHAEGPTVDFHIRRFICGVQAIADGKSLLDVEELAREKVIRSELLELEETIREYAGWFMTYALVHDAAKIDTVSFSSPEASRGAKEGFFGHKYQLSPHADEASRLHYLKLFRAFCVHQQEQKTEQCVAAFFDEFEIETHYLEHAKEGAGERYQNIHEKIGSVYHVEPDDLAKLQFVIRNHIDAISFFRDKPNPSKYLLLIDRVNRAGFDADDVLDLLVAAIFLDVSMGSLAYTHGQFGPDLKPILNMIKSEALAAPERKRKREEARDLAARKQKKSVLNDAGLLGKDIFDLLEIPHGPERGRFMKTIRAAIEDPAMTVDFGPHTDEVRRRLEDARRLLTQRVRA